MQNVKWMVSFFLCFALAAGLSAQADDSAAAKAAAASWLASIDAADYTASWETGAAIFKSSITVDAWTRAASSARDPLGDVQSRAEKSVTMTTSLPGVPDGHYAVLQYDTAFANKAGSVETLTLALDGERWRVAGYFIK